MLLLLLISALVYASVSTFVALRYRSALMSTGKSIMLHLATMREGKDVKGRRRLGRAHARNLLFRTMEHAFECVNRGRGFELLSASEADIEDFYEEVLAEAQSARAKLAVDRMGELMHSFAAECADSPYIDCAVRALSQCRELFELFQRGREDSNHVCYTARQNCADMEDLMKQSRGELPTVRLRQLHTYCRTLPETITVEALQNQE
ncbi:MAG: hypothetical protein K2W95_22085 [Candidatus Obscuribacterales bacterium]|nr:hypothetical protein [Candidatus Obscuribacterales bacterium]